MASGAFYLVDEKHRDVANKVVTIKDVLYFKLHKGQAGSTATEIFDGKATEQHVKEYAAAYHNFKKANPSYKLPWGDDSDLVGVRAVQVGEVKTVPVQHRKADEGEVTTQKELADKQKETFQNKALGPKGEDSKVLPQKAKADASDAKESKKALSKDKKAK